VADRPPFHMLRAAFWLLAVVIATQSMITLVAGLGCLWMIFTGREPIGACMGVSQQIREIWAEMLAALLALLLASREAPPPD